MRAAIFKSNQRAGVQYQSVFLDVATSYLRDNNSEKRISTPNGFSVVQ
jgi:hypothetical protein